MGTNHLVGDIEGSLECRTFSTKTESSGQSWELANLIIKDIFLLSSKQANPHFIRATRHTLKSSIFLAVRDGHVVQFWPMKCE